MPMPPNKLCGMKPSESLSQVAGHAEAQITFVLKNKASKATTDEAFSSPDQ